MEEHKHYRIRGEGEIMADSISLGVVERTALGLVIEKLQQLHAHAKTLVDEILRTHGEDGNWVLSADGSTLERAKGAKQ